MRAGTPKVLWPPGIKGNGYGKESTSCNSTSAFMLFTWVNGASGPRQGDADPQAMCQHDMCDLSDLTRNQRSAPACTSTSICMRITMIQ